MSMMRIIGIEDKSNNIRRRKLSKLKNTEYPFTNIHNWPLQSFSQDYGIASHTTHGQ